MEKYKNYVMAKRKLEEKKELYIHFIIYLIVNAIAIIGTLYLYPKENYWFFLPVIGGVGLLAHYFTLYHSTLFFDRNWEKKELRKLITGINKEETHFKSIFEKFDK
jgi:Na+/proline symporter